MVSIRASTKYFMVYLRNNLNNFIRVHNQLIHSVLAFRPSVEKATISNEASMSIVETAIFIGVVRKILI